MFKREELFLEKYVKDYQNQLEFLNLVPAWLLFWLGRDEEDFAMSRGGRGGMDMGGRGGMGGGRGGGMPMGGNPRRQFDGGMNEGPGAKRGRRF